MGNHNKEHLDEKGLQFACTDLGNADRFVAMHRHDLKHLMEEHRWVSWNGTKWTSEDAKIYERARQTVLSIYDEAKACERQGGRQELGSWANRSQSKQRIEAMLPIAAEALGVRAKDFDSDYTKINCSNGVVDLKSGELISHSCTQLSMKCANANYSPSSKCPTWLSFLNQIFLDDEKLIAYVQRAFGYSITGKTDEHCLFIAYGLGSNGKTTLFETVLNILDDYGRTTEFSTFLNTDKSDARNRESVGSLKGIRFAVASETDSTKKWNEALVKKLTGGDTLTGAKLFGHSFEFNPTHKLWFQANHLPGVKDASHGFWRRPIVIPFRAKFEGAKIDTRLRDKLLSERDGIFAWLVAGARQYLQHGLGDQPSACVEAKDQYRQDNDILSRFVSEKLERRNGSTVGVQEVYRRYETWCGTCSETPQPLKFFTSAMEERGIGKKRTSSGMIFTDYSLSGERLPFDNDNEEESETIPLNEPARPSYDQWRRMSEEDQRKYR